MRLKYILFLSLTSIFSGLTVSAKTLTHTSNSQIHANDSLRSAFHFEIGSSKVKDGFHGNSAALDSVLQCVAKFASEGRELSVDIIGLASPDGGRRRNIQLARERADNSGRVIMSRLGTDSIRFSVRNGGINWLGLKGLVDRSSSPYKNKILSVLGEINEDGSLPEKSINELTAMERGRIWRALNRDFFPDLRMSIVTVYSPPRMLVPSGLISVYSENTDTAGSSKTTTETVLENEEEVMAVVEERVTSPAGAVATAEGLRVSPEPEHRFAQMTNILYYGILMPNLEFEWRINPKWSVSLEGDVAWYKKASKHKYYQIAVISPEVRRWFRTRKPWHGMYVGAFVQGTWYDLENGHKGHKGEGGSVGVSYGYMFPISRCLSFDAELGVGYFYTRHREYVPYDGHYIYQRTKQTSYFGPLKAKFSFVWRFGDKNRKGGDR